MRRSMQHRLNQFRSSQLTYITEGTAVSMNPLAAGTTASGAHGLVSAPHYMKTELIALASEGGFAIGQGIRLDAGSVFERSAAAVAGFQVSSDSTIIKIAVGVMPILMGYGTATEFTLTATKWQITVTPFYFGNP